ncbi:DUF3786 domain-containing protein [Desulfococcaceae bacterium HSG8]|nr:DUF3786 domain-containing protein [Desulfococcaceae bacterium HSG8]
MEASIFETHYEDYCSQVSELDFSSIKDTLGIELRGDEVIIPFLGEEYVVSGKGITDASGNRPNYVVCVILFKYLLLCPDAPVVNREWAALKDLRKISQFTNLNVFTSDTEKPIVKRFSGRLDALSDASRKLLGKPCDMDLSYDFAMEFKVLPRVGILLLFNDSDDEFPATCSVLFQRQAEHYLDPESLIMTGMAFAKQLKKLSA